MNTNLPQNLFYLRRKLGLSQQKFVGWLGISFEGVTRSNYYHYETGRHQPPLGDVLRLARRLNLSMEQLLFVDLSKQVLPGASTLFTQPCKHVYKSAEGSLAEYYEYCIFCKQTRPIGRYLAGIPCAHNFKPAGHFWKQCIWCGSMERKAQ